MLYLDSENKKDMQLYINCSGGEVLMFVFHLSQDGCFSSSSNHAQQPTVNASMLAGGWHVASNRVSCALCPCPRQSYSKALSCAACTGTGGAGACDPRHHEAHRQRCGDCRLWSLPWHDRLPDGGRQKGFEARECRCSNDSTLSQTPHPTCFVTCALNTPELAADADWARPLLQGKRYMLPNTTMMMHHPSGVARGQASDIQNEAKELLRVRNYVNTVLAVATDQPVERVSNVSDKCG